MKTEKIEEKIKTDNNSSQTENKNEKPPTNFSCVQVTEDDASRRIDRVIRKFLPTTTLSNIYSSFRKGLIKLNGKKTQQDKKVLLKDKIWIHNSLLQDLQKTEQKASLKNNKTSLPQEMIIFQSKDILCINKPSGMAVHGGEGIPEEETATALVLNDYEKKHGFTSLSFKPGPLHRIDKATSGLVLFSQSLQGAKEITSQIEQHKIRKIYIAVVRGNIQKDVWEDNLLKTENQAIVQKNDNGKYAKTSVFPIVYNPQINESLVSFEIETGRTHQIRVQSSIHGHPISNDLLYDKNCKSSKTKHNFFLHAWKLFFPIEKSIDRPDSLVAPFSKEFSKFCDTFFSNWKNEISK